MDTFVAFLNLIRHVGDVLNESLSDNRIFAIDGRRINRE